MKFITKYFYEDGTEIKEGDLVYLVGSELEFDLKISGIFKIFSISNNIFGNNILTVHFLGQDIKAFQEFTFEDNGIEVILPVRNNELNKMVEDTRVEMLEKIKDME